MRYRTNSPLVMIMTRVTYQYLGNILSGKYPLYLFLKACLWVLMSVYSNLKAIIPNKYQLICIRYFRYNDQSHNYLADIQYKSESQ